MTDEIPEEVPFEYAFAAPKPPPEFGSVEWVWQWGQRIAPSGPAGFVTGLPNL